MIEWLGKVGSAVDEDARLALGFLGARDGGARRTLARDECAVGSKGEGLDIAVAVRDRAKSRAIGCARPKADPSIDECAYDKGPAVRSPFGFSGNDHARIVPHRGSETAERTRR